MDQYKRLMALLLLKSLEAFNLNIQPRMLKAKYN